MRGQLSQDSKGHVPRDKGTGHPLSKRGVPRPVSLSKPKKRGKSGGTSHASGERLPGTKAPTAAVAASASGADSAPAVTITTLVVPEANRKELRRRLSQGKTPAEDIAGLLVEGIGPNTLVASEFLGGSVVPESQVDLTALYVAMDLSSTAVAKGDLRGVEKMLAAQTVSLNGIFVALSQWAKNARVMDNMNRYMRLALRAQSQCTRTAEVLATMLNPPVVIARQANVVQGDQQVNTAVVNQGVAPVALVSPPTKLLGAHGERLDIGTEGTSGAGDPPLEAVAEVDRAENGRGQGPRGTERVPRRRAPEGPSVDAPAGRVTHRVPRSLAHGGATCDAAHKRSSRRQGSS